MLSVGGYINILIAAAHIVGLVWADKMFQITGIGTEMKNLSLIHSALPYLLTIFVAVFFLIFGLYGLSADNKFRKLPFQRIIIYTIAGIYLFRGTGELCFSRASINSSHSIAEISYSLVAIIIGLLFLIGGIRKWEMN